MSKQKETAMSKSEININTQVSIKTIPFPKMEDPEELAFSEPEARIYLSQEGISSSFEDLHRYFFKRHGWYYLKN